jgi:hypothetical protein
MVTSPLTVRCQVCGAGQDSPCFTEQGKQMSTPHRHRYVQVSGRAPLAVPCDCGALVNDLCINLRSSKLRNVSFHLGRERAAYAAGIGDLVPGLTYPDGDPVRRPWVLADRNHSEYRAVKFYVVGFDSVYFWAATGAGRVWYAADYKSTAVRELCRARASIVDQVAHLNDDTARTIWQPDVVEKYKSYTR